MTAATPGQAAYEAWGGTAAGWNGRLNTFQQAGWETIGQAAVDAFLAGDSVSAESIREALAAQEPHAADGKTPGQLAYEQVARARLMVFSGEQWADLTKQTRAAWEATAAVVETAQARLARADRDQLRKHVLDQAADLDISAAATRPSRKSDIESEIAIALRKIAEPPA